MSSQEVGDIFGSGKGPADSMLRSPTVLIVAIGLWGMNLFFFRLFGINYKFVLMYDLLQEEKTKKITTSNAISTTSTTTTTTSNERKKLKEGLDPNSSSSATSLQQIIPQPPSSSNTTILASSINNMNDLMLSQHNDENCVVLDTTTTTIANTTIKDGSFNETVGILGSGTTSTGSGTGTAPPKVCIGVPTTTTKTNSVVDYSPSSMTAGGNSITSIPGATITWYKLVIFSLILLLLLHATTRFWIDTLDGGVIGAVLLFYSSLLIYIFIPLSGNQWLRRAFYITLQRTWALIHPRCWCCRPTSPTNLPREVPFIDVFYADAMCSLSKVFFDWGFLLHQMAYYPNPVGKTVYNIIVPSSFAAIPFLIRARQCLLMLQIGKLKKDPKRYHHLANAIKYSTSIWPLILSAYQKTMLDEVAAKKLDPLLFLLQT